MTTEKGQKAPLTKKDLSDIDRALAQLREVNVAITRAKQAGLDVSGEEARAKQLEATLLAIKRAYSPTV